MSPLKMQGRSPRFLCAPIKRLKGPCEGPACPYYVEQPAEKGAGAPILACVLVEMERAKTMFYAVASEALTDHEGQAIKLAMGIEDSLGPGGESETCAAAGGTCGQETLEGENYCEQHFGGSG
ncbi:MAG: hypothetical protein Q8R92_03510 [Deltaproteobacteria bacterium]|nr:hypothetical protein [Deltaproteobacteria bacterium]